MSTDTRTIILQTARRLFVQQGFTATSIRQLAQEAGIGKATIYHYFADKQAIVLTLLDQEMDVNEEAMAVSETETDPRRRIEMVVHASIAIFQRSMDLIQVVQREVPAGRKRLDAGFHEYWEAHTLLIAAAIEQGQAEDIFRDVNPMQAAQILITTIFGQVTVAAALGKQTPPPKSGAKTLLDIFYQGIEK